MSLVRFDPSVVKVKQSFNVSQIVGYPVILSYLVLFESVNSWFASTRQGGHVRGQYNGFSSKNLHENRV